MRFFFFIILLSLIFYKFIFTVKLKEMLGFHFSCELPMYTYDGNGNLHDLRLK